MRGAVATVACCCAALGLASSTQAGVWSVFATYCLSPMEDFQLPDVSDLHDLALGRVFVAPDGVVLTLDPEPACVVSGVAAPESIADSANWFADAVASGRYEQVAEDVLQSTLWREPRLELRRVLADQSIIFAAIETDLES